MTAYVIRRLLLAIPTLLLATILVFLSVRFIPGNIVDLMVQQISASGTPTPADTAHLTHELGLDVPIPLAYLRWLGVAPQESGQFSGLIEGDFGKSIWTGEPVTQYFRERLPVSLELAFFALFTALVTAIPIGIYSAIRQDDVGDYLGRSLSIIFISVPSFWLATLVIVYPSIWWNWTPPIQYHAPAENLALNLEQFVIAGFIMGMAMAGAVMRLTRTMMLEVLRQDYIRTAWAKGLREYAVVARHALKNAMIPVITMIGMMFAFLVGGTIIMEQIFDLPGMGLLMFQALNSRDYPIISGVNVFVAAVILLTNLGIDLTYAWLDPRVRYQ